MKIDRIRALFVTDVLLHVLRHCNALHNYGIKYFRKLCTTYGLILLFKSYIHVFPKSKSVKKVCAPCWENLEIVPSYKSQSKNIEVRSAGNGLLVGFMPHIFDQFLCRNEPWIRKCIYTGLQRMKQYYDEEDTEKDMLVLRGGFFITCYTHNAAEARDYFGQYPFLSFL